MTKQHAMSSPLSSHLSPSLSFPSVKPSYLSLSLSSPNQNQGILHSSKRLITRIGSLAASNPLISRKYQSNPSLFSLNLFHTFRRVEANLRPAQAHKSKRVRTDPKRDKNDGSDYQQGIHNIGATDLECGKTARSQTWGSHLCL